MRAVKIIQFVLVASLLLWVSCKQQQPDWSGVITFSVPGAQTLVADGYDTLQLTAHINPNSDPNNRMITFTTDYGTFTNGLATIEVNADLNGNASTAIKGTVAATATVTATVQTTFSVKKTINFVTPAATAIFTVNPIAGSVPADGVTLVAIGVAVNAKLLITPQSVAFTTTGGTFTNGTATINQAVDPNGNAIAYLKSSTAGTVYVSITNNNVTQIVSVTFVAGSVATIFTVKPITGTAPADGVTTIPISVVVNSALLVQQQNVVFTSDGGTFGNGTVTVTQAADQNGNAIAYLKSSVVGTFQVSITYDNLTQVIPVTFVPALPDAIVLSAPPTLLVGISAPNSLPVSITLLRNIGTASPGLLFNYSYIATGNTSALVGLFGSETASSTSGTSSTASFVFSTGTSAYTGTITIAVAVQNTAIISTVTVQVVN